MKACKIVYNKNNNNAFQIFEATDANDLEVAMVVFRGGTHTETAAP